MLLVLQNNKSLFVFNLLMLGLFFSNTKCVKSSKVACLDGFSKNCGHDKERHRRVTGEVQEYQEKH